MKALILAGGGGTRLWPTSRQTNPKQFLKLYETKSLLRLTYERIANFFLPDDIWLATAIDFKLMCQKEIPEIKNYSLEPVARNTAPAIGLALLNILATDPEAIVVTVNSDHYIANPELYLQVLKNAEKVIQELPNKFLCIGVKTQYPETGYGYIKRGNKINCSIATAVYEVERFIEKPDMKKASQFHKTEEYLWNPAIFVFYAKHLFDLYKKHLPEHYQLLIAMQKVLTNKSKVNKLFEQMKSISIDYGILEKATGLLVLPVNFGWSDIGSWSAVGKLLPAINKNRIKGEYISIASNNNIIVAEEGTMVATIGVDDMIIIKTKDAVLVAKKDKAQLVREVVAELQQKDLQTYL
jgi:mannose-1-phosphate guanylyltransferase